MRTHISFLIPSGKIFICVLCCFLTIYLLVVTSPNSPWQKNGFKRHYLINLPVCIDTLLNKDHITEIAGVANEILYFSTSTPGEIIVTDSNLRKPRTLHLTLPKYASLKTLFTTSVTGGKVYIMAGNTPAVITASLTNSRYSFHSLSYLFTTSVIADSNLLIVRTYVKINNHWNQVFAKYNTMNNTTVFEKNVSQLSNDAGFSTDGNLLYDKVTKNIMYVHYYSNNVLKMDTSLQLISRTHTIDTFYHGTTYAKQNNMNITNGTPQHEVNLESTVSNGRLYIHSAVKADNDGRDEFKNNAVIDVYNTASGAYIFSFLLPIEANNQLIDFSIFGRRLVALYTGKVCIYLLPAEFN